MEDFEGSNPEWIRMMNDVICSYLEEDDNQTDNLRKFIRSHLLPPEKRNDKPFIIQRIREISKTLLPAVPREFKLALFKFFYSDVSLEMRADKELVMAFLNLPVSGIGLGFDGLMHLDFFNNADHSVRDDEEVLMYAFKQSCHRPDVFQHASRRLRGHREVFMSLLQLCTTKKSSIELYNHASDDLRADFDLVEAVINIIRTRDFGHIPRHYLESWHCPVCTMDIPFSIAIRKDFVLLAVQKTYLLCNQSAFETLFKSVEHRQRAIEVWGSDVDILCALIRALIRKLSSRTDLREQELYVLKQSKMVQQVKCVTKKLMSMRDQTLSDLLLPGIDYSSRGNFDFKKWNIRIHSDYKKIVQGIHNDIQKEVEKNRQNFSGEPAQKRRCLTKAAEEQDDSITKGPFSLIAEFAGFDGLVKEAENIKQLTPLIQALYDSRINLHQIFGREEEFWQT